MSPGNLAARLLEQVSFAKAQGLAPAPGHGLSSTVLPQMRGEAAERAGGSDNDSDVDAGADADADDHKSSSSSSSSSSALAQLSVLCRTPDQVG